jgi:hypothetical protein
MECFFSTQEYILTRATQFSKECKDGKQRNFLLYFLNGNLILKQKYPYDESWEIGFDKRTRIYDEFLLNGRLHQTRKADDQHRLIDNHYWEMVKAGKVRHVSFPISKAKLEALKVPKDHKIEIQ